jgi:asparagine synthase (glutamine-hydrolysing)
MSTFFGIFCPSGDSNCNISFQEMTSTVKNGSITANHHLSKVYFAHEAWQTEELGFPLWSSCGNFLITGHFRIDYKDELVKRLSIDKKDADLYSDGQLALLSYQKWGEKCVKYLEGDWAFALYDKERNSIFFARDQFLGNSALYYTKFENRIYFSSDLNVFKSINHLPLKINHTELVKYSFKYLPRTRGKTLFENVKYVEPAKTINFNHELKPRENIYWKLEDIPEVKYQTDLQYIEHFRELFDNAVKTRLPKTTKTGIFLSSGYDSSAVASYAASHLQKQNKRLYSFTSIPAYSDQIQPNLRAKSNEQSLVESFAKGIPNLSTSFEDFKDTLISDLLLSDITSDLNDPMIIPNTTWLNGFFQNAKERGIGRILNGQRGNAFISWHGPRLHSSMAYNGQWIRLLNEINTISKIQNISKYEIIKTHLYRDFKSDFNAFKSRIKPIHKHELFSNGLLNDDIISTINWKKLLTETPFIPNYSPLKSSKNIRRLLSENAILRTSSTWHALAQRHKIGVTDPTCDIRVVKFSLGIPENLWYKNGIKRYLYKEAFNHRIPDFILNNRHMIQSADIGLRIEKDKILHLLINEILSGNKLNGILNTKNLEACWLEFCREPDTLKKNHLGAIILNNLSFCFFIKNILTCN